MGRSDYNLAIAQARLGVADFSTEMTDTNTSKDLLKAFLPQTDIPRYPKCPQIETKETQVQKQTIE